MCTEPHSKLRLVQRGKTPSESCEMRAAGWFTIPFKCQVPYENSRRINIYYTTTFGLLEGWSSNQCLTETWTAGHFELQKAQPPKPICAKNNIFCATFVWFTTSGHARIQPCHNRIAFVKKHLVHRRNRRATVKETGFTACCGPHQSTQQLQHQSRDWIKTSFAAFCRSPSFL